MIRLARDGGTWICAAAADKLRARAKLPGAFAFDRAAVALSLSRERGVSVADLLPLACASSWFVNNAAPSPVFRKWITSPGSDVWSELVLALREGPWEWSRLTADDRDAITGAIAVLAVDGQGAGAISKVLALLVPEAVPLMPDAALWFALGAVARPAAADAQTAGVDQLAPMMDWFTREAMSIEGDLEGLAASASGMSLYPAQVLDRLVWFDSVGYRHFRSKSGAGWYSVIDGERRGVVFASTPLDGATDEPIDLRAESTPAAFRDEALRALDGSRGPSDAVGA